MTTMRIWVTGLIVCGWLGINASSEAAETWQAGFSKVVITPAEPMWLSGYAGRTAPSEGKIHDLHARACALRDPAGKTIVVVGTDLIGVPAKMAQIVCDAVKEKHGLDRSEIMLTCSHTHCGPALDDGLTHIYFLPEAEAAKIPVYQNFLNAKLIEAIGLALADLKPAQLATGIGSAAFASNRRPPIGHGPIDHDVPVLRVLSEDGSQLRGFVFGYACHNTTLSFQMFCGDYAGFACQYLEERHPEAVALFWLGCGGDQNPLPRRKIELAEKYGRMLALAVDKVAESEMKSLTGKIQTDFQTTELPLAHIPTQEEFEAQVKSGNKYVKGLAERMLGVLAAGEKIPDSYDYPIQIWKLGDVTWVALGGEVTVEYSLRLKERFGQDSTWVTGYANDVMGYIPSEKVLEEGGYEGESSMVYYQIPSKWAPGIEANILGKASDMFAKLSPAAGKSR